MLSSLVALVRQGNLAIQTHIIRGIACLSRNDSLHGFLQRQGVLTLLLDVIMPRSNGEAEGQPTSKGKNEKRVVEAVLAALTHLAKHERAGREICGRGLHRVVGLLHYTTIRGGERSGVTGVRCNALALLASLALNSKHADMVVMQDQLLVSLFQLRDQAGIVEDIKTNARYALKVLGYSESDPSPQYKSKVQELQKMGFPDGSIHLAIRKTWFPQRSVFPTTEKIMEFLVDRQKGKLPTSNHDSHPSSTLVESETGIISPAGMQIEGRLRAEAGSEGSADREALQAGGAQPTCTITSRDVTKLIEMGFDEKLVRKALAKTQSLDHAVDWLFSASASRSGSSQASYASSHRRVAWPNSTPSARVPTNSTTTSTTTQAQSDSLAVPAGHVKHSRSSDDIRTQAKDNRSNHHTSKNSSSSSSSSSARTTKSEERDDGEEVALDKSFDSDRNWYSAAGADHMKYATLPSSYSKRKTNSASPDVLQVTRAKTSAWLQSNGFGEYVNNFVKENVSLETLSLLSIEDLERMGVDKLGDRKRILHLIKSLKQPSPERKHNKEQHHIAVLQASPLVGEETPGSSRKLDMDTERRELCDSFRECGRQMNVRFGVATSDNLLKMITQGCKGLHISGHGDPSNLVLEDGFGGLKVLKVDALRNILVGGGHELQFVFISACFSARAAHAFVEAGVPHVIAVQERAQVTDTSARAFARHVYMALCRGKTVKQAFHAGRAAVIAEQSTGYAPPCCCAHLHDDKCLTCSKCNVPSCCSVHGTKGCHVVTECCCKTIPHGDSLKFLLLPKDGDHEVKLFEGVPAGEWRNCTPDKILNNLPSLPDHFNGRSQDLFQIVQTILKKESRISCIVGAQGIGKSTLARAAASYVNIRFVKDTGRSSILMNGRCGCTVAYRLS